MTKESTFDNDRSTKQPVHALAYRLAQENFPDMKILEPELTFADAYASTLRFYDRLGPEKVKDHEAWLNKNIRCISKSKGHRRRAVAKVFVLPTQSPA